MITRELQNMKPLSWGDVIPRDSEYLGAEDIDQTTEPILTIKNIYNCKVTLQRGKENKNVLTFEEESVPGIREVRPLILNSGNRQVLRKLFCKPGQQLTAGVIQGKKIQLWIEHGVRNPSKNELTDGIRIRDKIPVSDKKYEPPKCEMCKKPIIGIPGFTAEQIAANTKAKYGKCLCAECGKKAKAEMEAKAAEAKQEDNAGDLAAELMAEAEA